jgi:hypothetical protein
MSNSFLTSQIIAKEALARLQNNLVFANLVHRDFSNEFASKGDTIQVRKPATFTAQEFSSTTSPEGVAESNVLVKLDKIADVSVELTSKEMTLEIEDFGSQIVEGAMQALAQKIDADIANLYIDIPYYVGAGGTTPDGLDDFANVNKILNINKAPLGNRSLVLDPEAQAKLIVLDGIVNVDASGSPEALRNAAMGRVFGLDTYMDQNIVTHAAGAFGLLADVTGTGTAGATSIVLTSAAGASTAKLNKGDVFTVDGYQYVVTAQTAAAVSGVVTVAVYPALRTSPSAKAVSFGKSCVNSLGFHKNAIALVNRPMALPMGGANGAIASYNGLSIRVTMGYTMSSKINTISFDVLYGTKVLTKELAVRLLG